jgi:hypothetical protein
MNDNIDNKKSFERTKLAAKMKMKISDLQLKRKSTNKTAKYNNTREALDLYNKLKDDQVFQHNFMVQNQFSVFEYVQFFFNLKKNLQKNKSLKIF